MRIAINRVQQAKVGLHCIQGLLIFIAGVLIIAIFTKPGDTDRRAKWYFALVRTVQQVQVIALYVY